MMQGLLIGIVIVGILYAVLSVNRSPTATSPAPTGISEQLAFNDQAKIEVRVSNQINLMNQVTAMGMLPDMITQALAENKKLKDDMDRVAAAWISTPDHDSASLVAWQTKLHWTKFLEMDEKLQANTAP